MDVSPPISDADAPPAAAMPEVSPEAAAPSPSPRPFCPAPLLSARELRRLRQRQSEFAQAVADQFSLLFGLDFQLTATEVQPLTFAQWSLGVAAPAGLTLFRLEPLPGVCLFHLPNRLGLAMVDRLLGGPGQASGVVRELSDIETALFEQVCQVLLDQWRQCWRDMQALRPVLIGRESEAAFLTPFSPGTTLVALGFQARMAGLEERMELVCPFSGLEPLLRELPDQPVPVPVAASAGPSVVSPTQRFNGHPAFETLPLSISASLESATTTARQIANLKPGDWLGLPPACANQVRVRIEGRLLFLGRLGTRNGQWAVQLTQSAAK